MSEMQRTIKESILFSGVGLHTGKKVDVEISPAKENYGYRFQRIDIEGQPIVRADCDLVVSTSNVTIHVAGALAKETWVLLPYVVVNFWWLTERPKSIWYPTLTLYRQPTLDDWDSVYESVRKNLISKIL